MSRAATTRTASLASLALSLGLLSTGAAASAQTTRDLDVERFVPAADGDGFLSLTGTRTPGPWRWNAGFFLNYSRDPVTVTASPREVLTDRLDASLLFQVGLGGRVAAVVHLPVVLWQGGPIERIDGGPPVMTGAIRDARVALRYRLLGEDATAERERHEGEGLALQVAGTIPWGQRETFASDGLPQVEGAVIGDFRLLDLGIGASLGYRHRFAEPRLLSSSFRNQLFAIVGVQVPLGFVDHIAALGELDLTTDAENPFGDGGSTASEGRVGARFTGLRDVEFTAAVGFGLVNGVGAPLVRGVLGVQWAPRVHDRDHDGIEDERDECATLPEDFDGHDDANGCPDPDNDGDLVPDLDDRCPAEAAELGRDEDDDGCTDPILDADEDGVLDSVDGCLGAAEDRDGFEDEDGCGDWDNDGDAIADANDRCPGEAEDRDGFEDEDGCTDPDNDRDGVADATDACTASAEDRDGTEDDDGCADLDDDHDGVLDAQDRCPGPAETLNGVEDADGCPDRGGRALFRRTPGGLRGSVRFAGDTLAPGQEATLRELARHLIAMAPVHPGPAALRLRVGVGTDAAVNTRRLDSLRRAVQATLAESGVTDSTGTPRHELVAEGREGAVLLVAPVADATPSPADAPPSHP